MKKTSKILLLVLAVTSLFFNINVNAETTDEEQITSAEVTKEDGTLLTQDEFKKILESSNISLNITTTEFGDILLSNNESKIEELNEEIKETIKNALISAGYTIPNTTFFGVSITDIFCGLDEGYVHISNVDGYFKFNFKEEDGYNEAYETAVKTAVSNIEFGEYANMAAVFSVYELGDTTGLNSWTCDTYDYSKLINDSSITIKCAEGAGFESEDDYSWGKPVTLLFYKDNRLYATKNILDVLLYGITLENGTPVAIVKQEESGDTYNEMKNQLESTYPYIVGYYELKAYGATYDNMEVSFKLGTKYNGKELQVIHKKSDGSYEKFEVTVVDGKATITVNEFSPFLIASKEKITTSTSSSSSHGSSSSSSSSTNTSTTPEEPIKDNITGDITISNNPQTGALNIVLYGTLTLGSLVGIIYLIINKKKEIA